MYSFGLSKNRIILDSAVDKPQASVQSKLYKWICLNQFYLIVLSGDIVSDIGWFERSTKQNGYAFELMNEYKCSTFPSTPSTPAFAGGPEHFGKREQTFHIDHLKPLKRQISHNITTRTWKRCISHCQLTNKKLIVGKITLIITQCLLEEYCDEIPLGL